MTPSPSFIERLRGRASSIVQRATTDITTSYANALSSIYSVATPTGIATRFSNMRPGDYENIVNKATSSIAMGNTYGMMTATKFSSDVFMYGTMPAVRMAGSAAGRYGNVITSYLQTKEQIKQEWKMMGMQLGAIGGAAAGNWLAKFVGGGLIRTGISTLAGAGVAALTGVGIVAAIPAAILGILQIAAGFLIKAAVQTATTAAGAYAGSKIGEKFGEEYGEKYSNINLGSSMLGMTRDVMDTYQKAMPYLMSREGGSIKFDDMLDISEKLDESAGMDLDIFGLDTIRRLEYATDFSKSYSGKDVQSAAGYSMMLDNISGTDMSTGIKEYAKIIPSSKSNNEIEVLRNAVETYLGAAVGEGKINRSAFEVAKGLMEYSSNYIIANQANEKEVSRTFSGLFEFMNKAKPGGVENIQHITTLTGAFDFIFKQIQDGNATGARFANTYNINFDDTVGGIASHPQLINTLLDDIGARHNLQKLRVDEAGKVIIPDDEGVRRSIVNMKMFYTHGRGGIGLGEEAVNEIIRAIAIRYTHGNVNLNAKDFKEKGNAALTDEQKRIKAEDGFKVTVNAGNTTNKLLDASTLFMAHMSDFTKTVRNFYKKQGNLMAEVMLKEMERLTGADFTNNYETDYIDDTTGVDTYDYHSQPGTYGTDGVRDFSSFPVVGPQNRKAIDTNTRGWKEFILAKYGPSEAAKIRAKLEEVAGRLKIDPNDLAAMYSIESSWDTRADNGNYFGLNQLGRNELKLVGLNPSTYKAMSAVEQIEVTYQYLEKLKVLDKIKTAGDIYAITIAQSYFIIKGQKGDNHVVYKEGSNAYKLNAAAWNTKTGDGGITIAEIGRALYSHNKTKMFGSFASTAALPPRQDGYVPPGMTPTATPSGTGVKNPGDDRYKNARGDNIASVGLRFMRNGLINSNTGTNYWMGFCAAFVNRVLQVTGDTNLFGGAGSTAWTVRNRYLDRGLLMTKQDAGGYQVGDVIFWNRDAARGGHVAIYAGNGMVVQAGNFSTKIETRSVREVFGASEDVLIFRPGKGEVTSAANQIATSIAPIPLTPSKPIPVARDRVQLEPKLAKLAAQGLSSRYTVVVKQEASGGYKFVVKYNTGNGYRVVNDKKILRTVEENIERGVAKQDITVKKASNKTHYFFVEGTNVDVGKLVGALTR